PEGKVFCYFGPAWLVNFCMAADVEGSVGNLGKWGAAVGPQGFFWGGTWICAAAGTDNASTVKDIILKLTTDEAIMTEIVKKCDDFANNKNVMNAMAADTSYSSKILGGQNALGIFAAGVEKVDLSNLSAYDSGFNIDFQAAITDYIKGATATKEEALDIFYKAMTERYPELTY
ncbi:MAG: carbohydrate ABC transporter substrate-binding protein, partial [Lachnospiraceae bacterium]|nr:carbohydrate ABC transporter substrate-binding protein [Lachnospiraceae bacterium]